MPKISDLAALTLLTLPRHLLPAALQATCRRQPCVGLGIATACLCLLLQGNPAAAAAAQAQRLSVAYNNLGGILKMQCRAAEAISCYEHVALLQPNSPEVRSLTKAACETCCVLHGLECAHNNL